MHSSHCHCLSAHCAPSNDPDRQALLVRKSKGEIMNSVMQTLNNLGNPRICVKKCSYKVLCKHIYRTDFVQPDVHKKVCKHQEPTLHKPQLHRRKVQESISVLNKILCHHLCTHTSLTVTDQEIQVQLIRRCLQVKPRCFQCRALLRDPNWWSCLNSQRDNNNSCWNDPAVKQWKIEGK